MNLLTYKGYTVIVRKHGIAIQKGDNTYCKDCGKHARREKTIVRDTGKTKVKEGDRYCSRCGCLLDWEDSENEQ